MRFTTERDQLSPAASFAARHTGGATAPLPALSGLRITAESAGTVRLTGYDYEASSTVVVPATVAEPGDLLLPGRVFAEIARSLPAGPVEVRAGQSVVEIAAGTIEFTLPTLPLADYPDLPSAPATAGVVDGSAFARAVAQMSRIVLPHDVIPVLSGALLEFGPETLTLTASDRFRVAIRELTWKPTDELPDRVVVPARLLADATKGLGGVDTVHIGASTTDESLVSIGSDDRLTTMRLLDDTYPPLRSKVPTEFSGAVTVRVDELRAALRRVCIVADRYAAVVLTMASGEVTVGAAGDVDTRGRERLQARLDGAGGAVAFNAGYLLDGLDGLDTPYARLSFNEGMRPALLTGCDELDGEDARDHVYVVMPRRSTGDRT